MADKVTTMRVPEEVLAYFEEVAELNDESRTDVMRRALIVGYETMRQSYSDLDHPVAGPILRGLLTNPTLLKLLDVDPSKASEVANRLKKRNSNRSAPRGRIA